MLFREYGSTEPAALKSMLTQRMVVRPNFDWEAQAFDQLQAYFGNEQSSRQAAQDCFLVSQGNLYVTHAVVRFVIM